MSGINNIILPSSNDPLLSKDFMGNIDKEIQALSQMRDAYRKMDENKDAVMQQYQYAQNAPQEIRNLWSDIEDEVRGMSEEQAQALVSDEDYANTEAQIQGLIQAEMMAIIRPRILGNPQSAEILKRQLENIRRVKKTMNAAKDQYINQMRDYMENYPDLTWKEYVDKVVKPQSKATVQ